ncbi:MAG: phosphoribosylamine--glycine ligase [Opitutaceae bacterium]
MPKENSLKVLVVGSGGREHALVAACLASPLVRDVIAAPGNGGMAADCTCFPVQADDIIVLAELARRERVDFVIVGPEVPLSLGLVDALDEFEIPAYGPSADGAQLEASKIFTKQLLLKHRIPTALAVEFDSIEPALAYLETAALPAVIKADGLAAGKGVVVAMSAAEAEAAVRSMLERRVFGDSGARVLIEECLVGEETSIHLVVSGRDFVVLPTSQDHKRAGENDTGPNTGGMGAYSPAELVDDALMAQIVRDIARPSVDAIAAEGIDFRGTLYIGIMITREGPKVLEFNTRFGDPETQVLLPRLATDPVALMHAAAVGELAGMKVEVKPGYACCVVLASEGYPGSHPKGEVVELPSRLGTDEFIFHAGTKLDDAGRVVTAGGRVFGATALGSSLAEATRRAYEVCDRISFRSKYLRRDIGAKQLRREDARV